MDESPQHELGRTPQRTVLVRTLAVLATVVAVIHFAVAGEHFEEYWAFGVFMLVVAWAQLGAAVGLLWRPSRPLLGAVAALNAGVIAVYVVTRTVGDVVGPTPNDPEDVGFGDMFCTVCEALLVVGAVVLILRAFDRPVPRSWAAVAVVSAATAGAVLLSVSLVAGGSEMVMSADAAAAAPAGGAATTADGSAMRGMHTGASGALSLPTDSPAGPVTMPMGMDMSGMKVVTPACSGTPTAQQQAGAVQLVNETWAADKKFQSLAVAKADGFVPLTPTGLAVVHYINIANYLAAASGGPTLNPDAPQSLVYANTPHGAVLVAVMYLDPANRTTTPQPGGCLTPWHVHTNLCFAGNGFQVVGLTHPTCAAGSVHRGTPPMMHVWFAPIPGGPTAVDAPGAQVVHAAEQVPSPPNGTA